MSVRLAASMSVLELRLAAEQHLRSSSAVARQAEGLVRRAQELQESLGVGLDPRECRHDWKEGPTNRLCRLCNHMEFTSDQE